MPDSRSSFSLNSADLVRLSIGAIATTISRPFVLPRLVELSWIASETTSPCVLDDRSLKAAFPSLRAFTYGHTGCIIIDGFIQSLVSIFSEQLDVFVAVSSVGTLEADVLAAIKHKTLHVISWSSVPKFFAAGMVNVQFLADIHGSHVISRLAKALTTYPEVSLLYLGHLLLN